MTETAAQEPTETKKSEKPCAATISGGDSGVWNVLLNHYKAPLAASYRAMLDHVRGTLNGDILKVTCESEMFKSLLDCKAVRDVLEGVTSQHTGQKVQVRFAVGEVGKKSPATKSAACTAGQRRLRKTAHAGGGPPRAGGGRSRGRHPTVGGRTGDRGQAGRINA